ncbi:hypothetical protein DSM03_10852 [Leeuwenhoekiella aestuarii]|uniref:Uncharacterized protein n=1 Tax=Leeuwenhoekiella aestuarii TaxID=2249426 RepID=A0A4Q0NRA0_9FLAO|nr:hypothetical protein DSM03_10852 [Leeuwenhoekiella aestuarii]RXG13120.1 hypothetical protein DSM04_10598 [Leeuwenhoekiella aestuarii]
MKKARGYGATVESAKSPVGYGLFPYEVACSWVGLRAVQAAWAYTVMV